MSNGNRPPNLMEMLLGGGPPPTPQQELDDKKKAEGRMVTALKHLRTAQEELNEACAVWSTDPSTSARRDTAIAISDIETRLIAIGRPT